MAAHNVPKPRTRFSIPIGAVAVATTVVLLALSFSGCIEWFGGVPPGPEAVPTPVIGLSYPSTVSEDDSVKISWTVTMVSRADVKWTDISKTISVNAIPVTPIDWPDYPTSGYVAPADIISVRLSKTDCPSGSSVTLVLTYEPTGESCIETTTTVIY